MTCRRVKRDLLMSMLYLARRPSVPVMPMRSEPARSTSSILLLRMVCPSLPSILMLRMLWLRELCRLSLCDELILFLSPSVRYLSSSFSSLHSKTNMFSTVNCSSLFQRSLSPSTPWLRLRVRLLREAGLRRS